MGGRIASDFTFKLNFPEENAENYEEIRKAVRNTLDRINKAGYNNYKI